MGQYYMALVSRGDEKRVLDGVKGEGFVGSKLMEHSWIGNHFVDSVLCSLYKNPARVIWMGDYADDDSKINIIKDGMNLYNAVWKNRDASISTDIDYNGMYYKSMYLVNHDKKEYLNIEEYIKECTTDVDWCVHFLPLLTAVGNGQGGGDYWGCNEENVGYWANDTIELVDEIPADYKKLDIDKYGFVEND